MKRKYLTTPLRHILLLAIGVIFVYPVFWMAMVSFKDLQEFYNDPWGLPGELRWENYAEAFQKMDLGKSYFNTFFVAVISLIAIVLFSFFTSYAIGRIKFKTSKILFVIFVSTMVVPIQVRLLPMYILERDLGIINTLWALIFPYISSGIPFSVFLLVGFLQQIPKEIDEAAIIDACSRFRFVMKILLPLSKPGIASVIIFQFMNIWNDMFLPLVLIQDPQLKTLALGILKFNEMYGNVNFIQLFAALVMINLPIIIVYVIFQRQFIAGLTSGAVKS